MGITRLSKDNINSFIKKISNGDESAFGDYLYNDLKILVRRKNPLSVQERSKRLYDKRRKGGLCVVCGEKVTSKNPLTHKLYRCCDKHHKEELAKKKKQRLTSGKKTSSIKTIKSRRK